MSVDIYLLVVWSFNTN